jgi:serine/threonine-protein kinase RsbW
MVQDITSAVELRLPSKLGFEKVAMQTASGVARLMGFPDDRIEDLKTAVAEACINAIEHGNRFDERLSIGIVLSMEDGKLEVKILDSGSGLHKKIHAPDIDRRRAAWACSSCRPWWMKPNGRRRRTVEIACA